MVSIRSNFTVISGFHCAGSVTVARRGFGYAMMERRIFHFAFVLYVRVLRRENYFVVNKIVIIITIYQCNDNIFISQYRNGHQCLLFTIINTSARN